jgi:hypothetical protein
MNNRTLCGRSSETESRPVHMNNIILYFVSIQLVIELLLYVVLNIFNNFSYNFSFNCCIPGWLKQADGSPSTMEYDVG